MSESITDQFVSNLAQYWQLGWQLEKLPSNSLGVTKILSAFAKCKVGELLWIAPLSLEANGSRRVAKKSYYPLWFAATKVDDTHIQLAANNHLGYLLSAFLEPIASENIVLGSYEAWHKLSTKYKAKFTKLAAAPITLEQLSTLANTMLAELEAWPSLQQQLELKLEPQIITDANLLGPDRALARIFKLLQQQPDQFAGVKQLLATAMASTEVPQEQLSSEPKAEPANVAWQYKSFASKSLNNLATWDISKHNYVNTISGANSSAATISLMVNSWINSAKAQAETPELMFLTAVDEQHLESELSDYLAWWQSAKLERWLPDHNKIMAYLNIAKNSADILAPQEDEFFWLKNTKATSAKASVAQIEKPSYLASAKAHFINEAQKYFGQDFATADAVATECRLRLELLDRVANRGVTLLRALSNVARDLDTEYARHGGFQKRFDDVNQTMVAARKEYNSWQRLKLAWNKYKAQDKGFWAASMNALTFSMRQRHKDEAFLRQFAQAQELLPAKRRKLEVKLEAKVMAVHKQFSAAERSFNHIQSDWARYDVARKAWDRWCQEQDLPTALANIDFAEINGGQNDNLATLTYQLQNHIAQSQFKFAMHYWEAKWLEALDQHLKVDIIDVQKQELQHKRWQRLLMLCPVMAVNINVAASFFEYCPSFGEREPLLHAFKHCFLLNAERASTSQLLTLLAFANQVTAVNNLSLPLAAPNCAAINDELALSAIADLDYDDLECFGSLNSKTSAATLLSFAAANIDLLDNYYTNPELTAVVKEIHKFVNIAAHKVINSNNLFAALVLNAANGSSEFDSTGKVNQREAESLLAFIQEHETVLKARYPDKQLRQQVAIVTPFRGQQRLIEQLLKAANLDIRVLHSFSALEQHYPVMLFSGVLTTTDIKPMLWDAERNILAQALLSAGDNFIIFSDPNLWQQLANTPSGYCALAAETIATAATLEAAEVETI